MGEDKEVKKQKSWVSFLRIGSRIAEAVEYQTGQPRFLTYDPTLGFDMVDCIDGDLVEYYPTGKDRVPYRPYVITAEILEKLKNNTYKIVYPDLYQRVLTEFDTFLDIEPQYKELEAIFALETYLQQKLNSIGYIFHAGGKDSGKTRALEVQNELCYRPLFVIEIPEADIFNYIGTREEGLCTILEDEAQELSDPKNKRKMAIYRSGYRKGANCPRILEGNSTERQQKFYKTFCSKAFSGYYMPKDSAFNSRNIESQFVSGHPKKDELLDTDKERMSTLKAELLIWRMKTYFEPLPQKELTIAGRVKEVWKGKILAAVGTSAENTMLFMANEFSKRKDKELHESLEAYVVRAVIELGQLYDWHEIQFREIWTKLLKVLGVKIVDAYEGDRAYVELLGYTVSTKSVGGILKSVLHGERNLRRGFGRTWKFEKEKALRLKDRFSIKDDEVKELGEGVNDVNSVNVETESNKDFWSKVLQ
jgi:hypothetical protein